MFILNKFRSILNKLEISPEYNCRNDNEVTSHYKDQEVEIGLPADMMDAKMNVTEESGQDFASDLYVDKKMLGLITGAPYEEKNINDNAFNYEVNGTVFREDINSEEYDKLLKFEVKDHLEKARSLTAIQKTLYGVIINSNVLVTEYAWNTIVCTAVSTCIVCDKVLDAADISDHIDSDNHKETLDKFKPLEKFEMNIVRKINNKYHCGICNMVFDDELHVESVSHGDNFMTAINKVSDVQTEVDINVEDDKTRGNINATDSSVIDSESVDGYYEDGRGDNSETGDKDIDINQNLFSYADVAKQTKKHEASEFVDVKLEDRTVQVKFDCYHMINELKNNKFYCMACKNDGLIKNKPKHCLNLNHVENLLKCLIIPDFKDHVIRKVDDKLYHCGHCNNLHMINEMKEHLETQHKKYVTTNVIPEREPLSKSTVIKSSPKAVKKNNPAVIASSVEDKGKGIAKVANKSNNINAPRTENQASANIPANLTAHNEANTVKGNIKQAVVPTDAPGTANIPATATKTAHYLAITTEGATGTISARTAPLAHNLCFAKEGRTASLHFPTSQTVAAILAGKTTHPHNIHGRNINDICVAPNQIVINPGLPKEYIVVSVIDQIYKLSESAFNAIQLWHNKYFCLVCAIWAYEGVRGHVDQSSHEIKIALSPFLTHTSVHLIRATKYGFHCAICDILMETDPIAHTWNRMHLNVFNDAICTASCVPKNPVLHQTRQLAIDISNMTTGSETDETGSGAIVKISTIDTEDERETAIEENDFDSDGYIYVKVKNVYTKITQMAYNGLVQVGHGARYCVFCSMNVFHQNLKSHVFSIGHILNVDQCKFLKKYEKHLLRQMSSYYHCALCNVCVVKKFLNKHLVWETHIESESRKVQMQTRLNDIKSGIREVVCQTQKEFINVDTKTDFELFLHIELRQEEVTKDKFISLNGVLTKIPWNGFHGIYKRKSGHRCIICQMEVKASELSSHVERLQHVKMLENNFLLDHAPALLRKINDSTLHCLTCNAQVNNDKQTISAHKVSKNHTTKYTTMLANKSDCDVNSDVLMLKGHISKKEKKSNNGKSK